MHKESINTILLPVKSRKIMEKYDEENGFVMKTAPPPPSELPSPKLTAPIVHSGDAAGGDIDLVAGC